MEHFGTAVLALLLGGCAAFDRAAPHAVTSDRTVPLDARVVAWLVGDLCRAAHPGIDPSPVDATLPVLAEGDGALRFRIARPADGPWRVACNARLAAPRRALAGDVLGWTPGSLRVRARTAAPGSADVLDVTFTPVEGGTAVALTARGAGADVALLARLRGMLALLAAVSEVEHRLAAGDRAGARAAAEHTLAELSLRPAIGAMHLAAPLFVCRAAAHREAGDRPAERLALAHAQSLAPDAVALRIRLARLDAELVRGPDARRGFAELAARSGLGDLAAAVALEQARAAAVPARPAPRPFDELARRAGDHRGAFAAAVERLTRGSFDPDLALRACDDALESGYGTAALHLLARHFSALDVARPGAAEVRLARAIRIVGPAHAARVLSAGRDPFLADRARAAWRDASPAQVGPDLLARIERLRSRSHSALASNRPVLPGRVPEAPGVAPLK